MEEWGNRAETRKVSSYLCNSFISPDLHFAFADCPLVAPSSSWLSFLSLAVFPFGQLCYNKCTALANNLVILPGMLDLRETPLEAEGLSGHDLPSYIGIWQLQQGHQCSPGCFANCVLCESNTLRIVQIHAQSNRTFIAHERFRPSLVHGIPGHGYEVCKDSTRVGKFVNL